MAENATRYYKKGDWNADCDICGRTYKASRLKKRWDGFMCCPQDWNIRQPQDFVRGIPDQQAPPWTRPETDNFTPAPLCTANGRTAWPGYAVPGCMIPGFVDPRFTPNPPAGFPGPNE